MEPAAELGWRGAGRHPGVCRQWAAPLGSELGGGVAGEGGAGVPDLVLGCVWGHDGCVEGTEVLGGDGYAGS